MFGSTLKLLAVAMVAALIAGPAALGSGSTKLSPAQISRLGARTEAAGFISISRYLVERGSSADTATLAARSEAKGYRALVRYQVQRAAAAEPVGSSSDFMWGDALAGAGVTSGVFLLVAAAVLMVRGRHVSAQLRH
jgi:hypothetical protein